MFNKHGILLSTGIMVECKKDKFHALKEFIIKWEWKMYTNKYSWIQLYVSAMKKIDRMLWEHIAWDWSSRKASFKELTIKAR